MISPRLSRRLFRHHLLLGVLSIGSAVVLYLTRPYSDVITRLSFASAWPGLVLIAFTLLIGPLKTIWGRNVAVSQDFRRDVGIWAGMMGVFHAVIGNCVHLRGRPWLYYIYEHWTKAHVQPFRHDIFGLANYTGLVSALVLLTLLATSDDASLRALGTQGWKSLQRWELCGVRFFDRAHACLSDRDRAADRRAGLAGGDGNHHHADAAGARLPETARGRITAGPRALRQGFRTLSLQSSCFCCRGLG